MVKSGQRSIAFPCLPVLNLISIHPAQGQIPSRYLIPGQSWSPLSRLPTHLQFQHVLNSVLIPSHHVAKPLKPMFSYTTYSICSIISSTPTLALIFSFFTLSFRETHKVNRDVEAHLQLVTLSSTASDRYRFELRPVASTAYAVAPHFHLLFLAHVHCPTL